MLKSYQGGISAIRWLTSPRNDVSPVLQYGLRPINGGALDWFDVPTEVAATPAPAASKGAEAVATVPWPKVAAYAGGADPEGVAAWLDVQLSDGPETVRYVIAPPSEPEAQKAVAVDAMPWLQALGELVCAAKDRDASREDQDRAVDAAHSKLFELLRATHPAASMEVQGQLAAFPNALRVALEEAEKVCENPPSTRFHSPPMFINCVITTLASPQLAAAIRKLADEGMKP